MSNAPDMLQELLENAQQELDGELAPYVEQLGTLPALRHPLLYSVPYLVPMNGFLNRMYQQKKQALSEALENEEYHLYVFLHERPYRAEALASISSLLADRCYWELLAQVWVDTENAEQCWPLWRRLVGRKRRRPEASNMMSAQEKAFLASLPDQLTIYRGHSGKLARIRDFSWSVDPKVAQWFARRFDRKGVVLHGTVAKDRVIAYLDRRNEAEIMVFPEDVIDIREATDPIL